MNYQKIYDALILKSLSETKSGYTERHHILPRCMGGSDDKDNLVTLSAREHFVAHLLLARIYGGRLIYAAHMMSNMGRYTNRDYKFLREEHAKLVSARQKGKIVSEETRRKISENKERSLKISKTAKGNQKPEAHIQNWKESRAKGAGWVCPEHKKESQRESMKREGNPMFGKTHSEEARDRIREANLQRVSCPHCDKVGAIAIMKRWHFDKCKFKDDTH